MKSKRFATLREARKYKRDNDPGYDSDVHIWRWSKKHFPRPRKYRYFVGLYIEWINL